MPRHMRSHKRQGSDCDVQAPWIDTTNLTSTDQPIVSPIAATVSSVSSTRTGKANEQQRTTVSRENSQSPSNSGLVPATGSEDGASSLKEAILSFRGTRVKVKFTRTHVSWKPLNPVGGCCVDRRSLIKAAAFDEILSAVVPRSSCCPRIGCTVQEYSFVIYTFSRRGSRSPNTWRLEEYVLSSTSPEVAKDWVSAINNRVRDIRDRPRNLLVFINPFAGARLARVTWERHVLPVFQRARIVVNAVETTKQDHAKEMLELMKSEDLAGYQGVVAVGGDGLFQEVVSGLLARRGRGDTAALKIRVGHVPAGSTDAVSYTLHGSRCPTTAALHIALGDRLSLDCGRVDAVDGSTRHFVCQAGYGFMGDVMRFSERLRFIGPGRYDITGALQYMRLASYRVKLSYREALSTTADVQQLCTVQCEVCRSAGIRMTSPLAYHRPGSTPTSGSPGKVGGASPRAAAAAAATAAGPASAIGSSTGLFRSSPPPLPAQLQLSGPAAAVAAAATATEAAAAQATTAGASGGAATAGNSGREACGGQDADGVGGNGATGMVLFRNSNPQLHVQMPPPPPPLVSADRPSPGPVPQSAPQSVDAGDGTCGVAAAGTPDSATAAKHASTFAASSTATTAPACGGAAAFAGGGSDDADAAAEGWVKADGEYVSIMCIVTPCRSDKSKRGIVPNGHLSDGRMYLVLVSRCSHLDFLRFLVRLSTRGLADRCLPFVRVVPVTALRLTPLPGGHRFGGCMADPDGPESAWNVDGELLTCNDVAIGVARGALEVFARGVETAIGG